MLYKLSVIGFYKLYNWEVLSYIFAYVIYPNYNENDLEMFDSYTPVLAEVAFYTDIKYKGAFSDGKSTPFVVLYDGKGNTFTRLGGTYRDLCEFIKREVPSSN